MIQKSKLIQVVVYDYKGYRKAFFFQRHYNVTRVRVELKSRNQGRRKNTPLQRYLN